MKKEHRARVRAAVRKVDDAIIRMASTFQKDVAVTWMAEQLGISPEQTKEAIKLAEKFRSMGKRFPLKSALVKAVMEAGKQKAS